MVAWVPGKWRDALALEGPFPDVPQHIEEMLYRWVEAALRDGTETTRTVALTHRIPIPEPTLALAPAVARIMQTVTSDVTLLLTYAETILDLAVQQDTLRILQLKIILDGGNSAYTLRSDWHGLELRVLPEARDAVESVIASARDTSVGAHLANAWNEAFGLSPDPVKSYAESIRAVEAAAAPVLTPKDKNATLGTLIGHLDTNLGAWRMAVPDGTATSSISTVLAMMRTLWQGQRGRHAGVLPTQSETAESAQAAVFVASALAQWFVGGYISRS